jgi:hypothetical protein
MALSSALSLPGMYYWGMAIRLVAIAAGEVQDAMCTCNCLPGSHREAAAARRSLVLFVLLALSLRPALFLPLSDLSALVTLSVFFPIARLAPLLQHQ